MAKKATCLRSRRTHKAQYVVERALRFYKKKMNQKKKVTVSRRSEATRSGVARHKHLLFLIYSRFNEIVAVEYTKQSSKHESLEQTRVVP